VRVKKIFLLLLFSCNLHAATLVLIGGGEHPKAALSYFIQKLQPGPIYVLPWGTSYPEESFEDIRSELEKLGAHDIQCFCKEVFTPENYRALARAGGIYFPGGDQNKIMQRIFQSHAKPLLQDLYQKGVPVAGTSAGTAIQTNPMLTGNRAETSEGLGLLAGLIVDQHFLVRGREERLLQALEAFPTLNGIGIDESMSAIIEDSTYVTAIGPSLVTLYIKNHSEIKKIELIDKQSLRLKVASRRSGGRTTTSTKSTTSY